VGQGRVVSTPEGLDCQGVCLEHFPQGAGLTLSASAAEGWIFAGWNGACASVETPSCTLTLDHAQAVAARFEQAAVAGEQALEVIVVGLGAVSSDDAGIACGEDCVERYTEGTDVTLTVTPTEHSEFIGWGGACIGAGINETCTLRMSETRRAIAAFDDLSSAEWQTFDGSVPSNAVVGGWMRLLRKLYVCRANYMGGVHPGKLDDYDKLCRIGWGGDEYALEDFEILVDSSQNSTLAWKTYAGTIPENAVVGGRNDASGTSLYICKATDSLLSGFCPGKVFSNMCNITVGGTEYVKTEYQVLTFGTSEFSYNETVWQVAEIYMATLGYAPDNDGLQYWTENIETQPEWTTETVAQSFFDQPLVQQEYPEADGYGPFIDALYRNIFGRDADAAGYAYWLNELEQGHVGRNQMIVALLNGGWDNPSPDAQADMERFGNRIKVALAFAEYQADHGIVYDDLSEADRGYLRQVGADILLNVTADAAMREAAIADISTLLAPLHD